jgi:hypothetical protein
MAYTTFLPKSLYQGQLSGSNATLYTVPSSTKAMVREILLFNSDSSTRIVYLFFVPSGGTYSNYPVLNVSLNANDTLPVSLHTIIEAAGTITGYSDAASKVVCEVSGGEIT